ncbi:MAG: formylglycine-generating enzyme family protein [Treponema sp.]|jgi:formylglycine-generating enzyme required for sulfatase activity|nr:formylglycine-generating enzyme family protein [Treponema sp.]
MKMYRNVFLISVLFLCFGCTGLPVVSAQTPGELSPEGFVYIRGGVFMMGSAETEAGRRDNEGPRRRVRIEHFYMKIYEVTQDEYREVMGINPAYFKGGARPVEQVSWYDAIEYCNRLSRRESLTPVYTINGETVTWDSSADGYRLPTEAEWEYACRAGSATPFSTGTAITTVMANYNGYFPYTDNETGIYRQTTTEVGAFEPNSFGLYDMHGNVWEWCWDEYRSYGENDAGAAAATDIFVNEYRVLRGGSWYNSGEFLRSACREGFNLFGRVTNVGFRLVRPVIEEKRG